MPVPTDPKASRQLSRAIVLTEPGNALARRASRPLRSVRIAPMAGKPDSAFHARQASEEGEEQAVEDLIAAPGNPSRTPSAASASRIVLDAATGQSETATRGAGLAARRAAATSGPAAASATWRGMQ